MAEKNLYEFDQPSEERADSYSLTGHPPLETLIAEQGTGLVTDVSVLHGNFWPEEDTIEQFLKTLHEWRGHTRTNSAA